MRQNHKYIGVTGAAMILGVAGNTVRKLERQGKLTALKTETGVRIFKRSDVERLAAARALQRGV